MSETREVSNVLEALKILAPGHPILNFSNHNGYENYRPVVWLDGMVRLVQWPPHPGATSLYRGEGGAYPSCKAGIYRVCDDSQRILELLKTYHFMLYLRNDPAVRQWSNRGLYVNYWLLAQHYEFRTPILDLSDEIVVAAFFAIHRYDPVTKGYSIETSGNGVIRCCNNLSQFGERLDIVGLQPLARPNQQDGYALWMSPDDDFAMSSTRIVFRQDGEMNSRLSRAMLGGTDYFPQEQTSLMAREIHESDLMPRAAIDALLADTRVNSKVIAPAVSEHDIEEVLRAYQMHIVDTDGILLPDTPPDLGLHVPRTVMMRPAWRG